MVNEQEYQKYRPPATTPEIILNNILIGVICVFLIVVGFFAVTMITATLDRQEAVQFRTFEKQFDITNPLLAQVVYTSNPLLKTITLTKYNSSNKSYGGVPSTDWTYDDYDTSIEVNAGALEHTITALKVNANTNYSVVPTESVLTGWAIALIVMGIGGIFGILAYSGRRDF